MDPNATLRRIRELVKELQEPEGDGYDTDTLTEELTELVSSLDNWLTKGGFLPKQWERK